MNNAPFKKFLLAPFLFLLLSLGASLPAVASDVDQDLAAWETIVLQVPMGERWRLNTLTQMRNNNNLADADRFLQFADINYLLGDSKHWSIGVGGAWTPTFQPKYRNESRVYEQVMYQHELKGGQFLFRNRLAQRFIEDAGSVAQWNRTLLQYSHPIAKFPGWYWVTSDEVFVQLYNVHNGPKGGFDQNRAYVALGKNLSKHVRLEGGYMLLFAHHPGPAKEGLVHTIMTQMVIH